MKRTIGALAVVALLTVASAAFAASSGTYRGTSVLRLAGQTATHPFALVVKNGRITDVRFQAGSDCEFLQESRGVPADLKITNGAFKGRVTLHGGPRLFLNGRFSGSKVSGWFTGTTTPSAANCTIPKNRFSAKR